MKADQYQGILQNSMQPSMVDVFESTAAHSCAVWMVYLRAHAAKA